MKKATVTIIGSFRRDPDSLRVLFDHLSAHYTVLSPTSIDWDNPDDEFVKVSSDNDKDIKQIEERHLRAINNSDFIVLFAPKGYVGLSGALEIGYAHAWGVPVIATERLKDQTLDAMIDDIFDEMSDNKKTA